MSHAGVMMLFALFLAIVFAVLMRDEPKEQIRLGVRIFGGLVGAAILVGWLLYPMPF